MSRAPSIPGTRISHPLGLFVLVLGSSWIAFGGTLLVPPVSAETADLSARQFPDFLPDNSRAYLTTVLENLEHQNPGQAPLLFISARVRSQLGQKREAEELALRATAADPTRIETKLFLSDLCILQERMSEALVFVRQALAIQPEAAGAQRRLGMILSRLGQRDEAALALRRAVQGAPTDATARLLLGRLLLEADQVKEAEQELQLACKLDPNQANALYLLAQAQERLGLAEAARRTLDSFQTLKAGEKLRFDAKNARYDDARFMRDLATQFHVETGEYYCRTRNDSLASAHLRQAIRLQPSHTHAWELLGSLLLATKQWIDAKEAWRTLVQLDPKDARYHANLGTLLLQTGDTAEGKRELSEALALNPNEPSALDSMARYLLRSGEGLSDAVAYTERLVKRHPTGVNYDLHGWALFANGRTNEACAAAAEAVTRDPTNVVYRERLRKIRAAK